MLHTCSAAGARYGKGRAGVGCVPGFDSVRATCGAAGGRERQDDARGRDLRVPWRHFLAQEAEGAHATRDAGRAEDALYGLEVMVTTASRALPHRAGDVGRSRVAPGQLQMVRRFETGL